MRALPVVAATWALSAAGCASEATNPGGDDPLNGKADVCSADDTQAARCFTETEPAIYDKSRAVLRVHISGGGTCTGWLVGAEGHVLTNHHCIRRASTAENTAFESMAEGDRCDTDCTAEGSCPGPMVATSATFLKTSIDFDYTLLKLPTNPTGELGYLQLRRAGARIGERIYIPQHPLGGGKRIAANAEGELATIIEPITPPPNAPCLGKGANVQYFADTQPGSSGSPVIAYSDHAVIALHHCNGCSKGVGNRGVAIEGVIADLGDLLPASAFSDSY
jgi:lysyl endopeptidase